LGLVPVLVIAIGLIVLQGARGDLFRFAHGRGEQLWSMLNYDYLVRMHVGPPDGETFRMVEVAGRLATRTLPEAAEVLTRPLHPDLDAGRIMHHDPPWLPLIPAALIPFALVGAGRSLRSLGASSTQFVVALCAAGIPMVLTTRIDAHRLIALAVPFTLWSAEGLLAFGRWLAHAGLGVRWRTVVFAMLTAAVLLHTVALVRPEVVEAGPLPGLGRLVMASDHPVVLVLDHDHRTMGGVRMAVTRRWLASGRLDPSRVVAPDRARALCDEDSVDAPSVDALLNAAGDATLVFHPAGRFAGIERHLADAGLSMSRFETGAGAGFTARRGP
jgi:hypothetical protein